MVWVGSTFKNVFDYREGDVYWCRDPKTSYIYI